MLAELINHVGSGPSLSEDGAYFAEARSSIAVLRNGLDGPEAGGYPPMLFASYEGRKFLSIDDAIREAGETQMEQDPSGLPRATAEVRVKGDIEL